MTDDQRGKANHWMIRLEPNTTPSGSAETVTAYYTKQEETMDADQRAKFEEWAKTYPKVFTSEAGWRACLDANGVEGLVEACRLLVDACNGLADQQAMPDDSWRSAVEKAQAALAKHEGNGNG